MRLTARSAVIISSLAAIAGIAWLATRGVSLYQAIIIAMTGGVVLAGILIFGTNELHHLQRTLSAEPMRIFAVPGALWGLYLIYAVGMNAMRIQSLAFMAVYLSLPFLLL